MYYLHFLALNKSPTPVSEPCNKRKETKKSIAIFVIKSCEKKSALTCQILDAFNFTFLHSEINALVRRRLTEEQRKQTHRSEADS